METIPDRVCAVCATVLTEEVLATGYRGLPGEPAPAQQGKALLKRRRTDLTQALGPEQGAALGRAH